MEGKRVLVLTTTPSIGACCRSCCGPEATRCARRPVRQRPSRRSWRSRRTSSSWISGLPGMDGLTATRKLKTDPATRDIPVVAVTSHAMKGDEETAREAGCLPM